MKINNGKVTVAALLGLVTSVSFANKPLAVPTKMYSDKVIFTKKHQDMLVELTKAGVIIQSDEDSKVLIINPFFTGPAKDEHIEHFDIEEIEKNLPTASKTDTFRSN